METPNYPLPFPASASCRWRVSPGHTRRVSLFKMLFFYETSRHIAKQLNLSLGSSASPPSLPSFWLFCITHYHQVSNCFQTFEYQTMRPSIARNRCQIWHLFEKASIDQSHLCIKNVVGCRGDVEFTFKYLCLEKYLQNLFIAFQSLLPQIVFGCRDNSHPRKFFFCRGEVGGEGTTVLSTCVSTERPTILTGQVIHSLG